MKTILTFDNPVSNLGGKLSVLRMHNRVVRVLQFQVIPVRAVHENKAFDAIRSCELKCL